MNSILSELPMAANATIGWSWTEESPQLPAYMPDGSEWLKISIVTPSYNQGQFLEETIRSVLLQGYPNIEYIIIDGGSTDNSVEVVNKYAENIAYWVSEPDEGQADAINKGFRLATGDLIGWQNSDDFYFPNTFATAAQAAQQYPEYDVFYGSRQYLNLHGDGQFTQDYHMSAFNLEEMIPNTNMANHSMFFRRKIFEDGNFLDLSFHHCMDHEFFWRLMLAGYQFKFIPELCGCYRLHDGCKASQADNTWLRDTIRICKWLYQDPRTPQNVRNLAWAFLRGTCLDHYGKLRLATYRQTVTELAKLRKRTLLDAEMIAKYCVSFLSQAQIKSLRKLKSSK